MNENITFACTPREAAILLVYVLLQKGLSKEDRDNVAAWWNETQKQNAEMRKK